MTIGDVLFLVLAAVLAWAAWRGLRAGKFAFTPDPRLATERTTSPVWFWGQFALIMATIAVLVVGALL
jgi:hypothetical protein